MDGGSQAAGKVNWNIVANRDVVIWPDNDRPGMDAAHIIASKINIANGHSGLVSLVDPANVKFGSKLHTELFDKAWDLGDILPAGVTDKNIKEVISNVREDAKALDKVEQLESKITDEFKDRELNTARNIIWQRRALGNIMPNHENIIEQTRLIQIHQDRLGNQDSINYMKYAISRGIEENAHEFMNLEHGIYRDTLAAISINIAKSNSEKENKVAEAKTSQDKISIIHDQYSKKINSINLGEAYHKEHVEQPEINSVKQTLYKTLVRDIIFMHTETLGGKLPAVYHKQVADIVYDIIKDYNTKSEAKLDILDKVAIAERVYSKVSDYSFWKQIACKNIQLAQSVQEAEHTKVKNSINNHSKEIAEVTKLNPQYNIENLKNRLLLITEKNRSNYIKSEWLTSFKEHIQPQMNDFMKRKVQATTLGEMFKALREENKFCNDVYVKHTEVVIQWGNKNKDNVILNNHEIHHDKPNFIDDLKIDTINLAKYKIMDHDTILTEIKAAKRLDTAATYLNSKIKSAIVNMVQTENASLEANIEVTRDGIKFKSNIEYLSYMYTHKEIGHYLKGTAPAKQLQTMLIQQRLEQHNRGVRQSQQNSIKMNSGMNM